MKVEQSESKSDDFCKHIYEQATFYLRKLMNDLNNKVAQLELRKLNEQIKQRNVKNKLLKNNLDDFLINIFMFIANFKNAKRFNEALKKNSTDNIAREKLIKINQHMNLVNEQRDYLRNWLITISSHSDTNAAEFKSETSEESFRSTENIKVIKKDDQSFSKDDVKIKVSVSISDESDDWTSFEKVVIVRSADFDSRIIVNREIDMNLYYNIHFEATFEKEIARQWLNERTYEIVNSSNDIAIDELKICERVKIAHIATTLRKRVKKQSQSRNNICYYFIKIRRESYLSIRTALSEMKRVSLVKLKRIDAALNHQTEMLLEKLNQCRENNEHSNIEEKLIDDDIKDMSWLVFEATFMNENEKSDAKNEDIDNLVSSVTGLKRDPKSTASSIDWSRQVKYSSSSQVFDPKSVESSWNFFEKVSSRIEKLNSRTRVELRSLTRQLDSKTRLDPTRY